VIEPVGDCWDDRKIVLELAKRMGIKTPWSHVEEFNDWILEPVDIKFDDMKKRRSQMLAFPINYQQHEQKGFKTPSGKVELYSSVFKNLGYDPLPYYVEPPESPYSTPDLFKEYPLIMGNHRHVIYTHSEFRQLPSYRKVVPDPIIEINPETAKDLGIDNGSEMWIERPGFEHRVKGKAKFIPDLHPNVVSCVPLWWLPEIKGPEHGCFEYNINSLISIGPPYDPINGNYQVRALLCRVGKA
jgi:anaerobic selenocysteine-containing dehydrogenase